MDNKKLIEMIFLESDDSRIQVGMNYHGPASGLFRGTFVDLHIISKTDPIEENTEFLSGEPLYSGFIKYRRFNQCYGFHDNNPGKLAMISPNGGGYVIGEDGLAPYHHRVLATSNKEAACSIILDDQFVDKFLERPFLRLMVDKDKDLMEQLREYLNID